MGKGERNVSAETSELTSYDNDDPEVVEDLNDGPTYEQPRSEPPRKKRNYESPVNNFKQNIIISNVLFRTITHLTKRGMASYDDV